VIEFHRTYLDILLTIEESIKQERIIPALILFYSAIDSFSLLVDTDNRTGRKVFKEWVRKWMIEKYQLPCNEVDIYSARCGLLHQQMSESNLTKGKEAREIYYAWGKANITVLERTIKDSDKCDSAVAVRLEDLVLAFRQGMANCLNEIEKDDNWKKSFDEKVKKLFIPISFQQ
jgi:hypothetical protein